jgi:hypothetical protein
MGQWFEFFCDDCGYSARVSGGPDAGMLVSLQTMTCHDCAELVDVITRFHSPGDARRNAEIGHCKRCNGNRLEPWVVAGSTGAAKLDNGRNGRPCPKCHGPMRRGGMMALWD